MSVPSDFPLLDCPTSSPTMSVLSLESSAESCIGTIPGAVPATHNPRYFINDDLSIFRVEDQLFRVHCYFLAQESSSFASLLRSGSKSSGLKGVTDDTAIVIPGVTAKEFETLLDFFYKGMHYGFRFELDDWVTLLSISTRLELDAIRKRAIQEINDADKNTLSPIDKIVLAEKYNVPEWLAPAYEALCRRDEPLEDSEAGRIGLRNMVLIARAREALREDERISSSREALREDERISSSGSRPVYPGYIMDPRSRSPTPPPIKRSRFDDLTVSRIVGEVFFAPKSRPSDL